MMVHIAGGARRGFNERFAQPSRTQAARVFPFTDNEQTDEKGKVLLGVEGALLGGVAGGVGVGGDDIHDLHMVEGGG